MLIPALRAATRPPPNGAPEDDGAALEGAAPYERSGPPPPYERSGVEGFFVFAKLGGVLDPALDFDPFLSSFLSFLSRSLNEPLFSGLPGLLLDFDFTTGGGESNPNP